MGRYSNLEVFQPCSAQLGEGPSWDGARQTLWWVDITGKALFESRLDGSPPRRLEMDKMIGAVAPTARVGLIAALQEGIHLIDPESGRAQPFAIAPGHDPREFRFNDGKVDPLGRFWAGTLAIDGRSKQSRLYRFSGGATVKTMREGVSISNGMAWAPDGARFYYSDSPTRTVQVFPFDLETGSLGAASVAITMNESDGWPDGCCMDAEYCLWIAHWGASKLTRWDPSAGRLLDTILLPVKNVTSCAFGGVRLDQLFITTARDTESTAPEPEAGHVFRIDPGTHGVELALFADRNVSDFP